MARKPMSEAKRKAMAAKSRATREKNKKKALELMGMSTERPKIRKPRKPMTPEQKKAAVERMKKAREARKKKAPPKNLQYAENVRNLPDDDPLSIKNVRKWINKNREKLKGMRGAKNSKVASERAEWTEIETYVQNLEKYLRVGVYFDNRAGVDREKKMRLKSVALAYYPDGTVKRTQGVFYPDLGCEWTLEMETNE